MLRYLTGAAAALAGLAGLASAEGVPVEEGVSTFSLDNGMQVVVIEDHRAPVVTHMVWYPVGSADEPHGRSGIAHFFEHLMFKGTDDLESGEFSRTVAENGGVDNAFTSYDYTGYFQRVAADRLGLMMSLEAERMKDLILTDEVVDTERAVILEERNTRYDNSPQGLFHERLQAMQYINHPYGIPIIGWRHEIETLDTEDAIAFYERYYAPDNAILVVAGDVTAAEVLALAEQHYGPLEPAGNPPDPRPKEPPQIEERRMSMEHPQVRQPYVLRYYTVPAYSAETAKDAAALDLVVRVLGSGITSMLSETVQIADGKAIGVGAWYSSVARDSATLAVWGIPADGVSLPELETAMDEVIETLKAEGPDAEQLERVRKSVLANEIYRLDDLAGRARQYGGALASGLTVEDVAAWPGLIEAATADEVRDAARKFLVPERSTTGYLMGPGEAADAEASEKEAG